MRHVQLDHVEACFNAEPRSGHELPCDLFDVLFRRFRRNLTDSFDIRQRRGGNQRPIALQATDSPFSPIPTALILFAPSGQAAGRSSPASAHGRSARSVARRRAVVRSTVPVQPGVMRPGGDTQVISVKTSPAPPVAREPRCTRCQSSGTPSRAQYCAIGDTTTRFTNCRSRRRNGRNIGGGAFDARSRAFSEAMLHLSDELRIAELQILMADALTARQQAVRELERLQMRVTRYVLEPLHPIARCALQLERLQLAFLLIALQRGADLASARNLATERNGVLHRQLGP